jgi:hypothetical protein
MALCRILPGAVYAKQGSSRRLPGKPECFFRTDEELDAFLDRAEAAGRRHLVVESNALALRGRGDVIIFLGRDRPAGGCGRSGSNSEESGIRRGARPDAGRLRSLAHLVLDGSGPGADPHSWEAALSHRGLESAMMGPVLGALAAQGAWNGRTCE